MYPIVEEPTSVYILHITCKPNWANQIQTIYIAIRAYESLGHKHKLNDKTQKIYNNMNCIITYITSEGLSKYMENIITWTQNQRDQD